ncbi:MAG: metallophosphoesterase [Bacteroidetes bacterium]|nr:metallophosphoesterase [Bacteroidota bacterium]
MRLTWFAVLLFTAYSAMSSGQTFTEILGRPTNSSVTMSILFDRKADVYWEYGTATGRYTNQTETYTTVADTALKADFTNLLPDHNYFYRTRYRQAGTSGPFLEGPEHFFHTQRFPGSTFSFAVEADPHLDTNSNPASYSLTLKNILLAKPDFLIDLGDIFMSEKLPLPTQANITARHLLYRPYLGATCNSVPLYLVIGNHEGENGWQLDGTPNSLPVLAANTRKLFYPNPIPDSFYSGDTISENYVGLRQNYYAWEWGNALFIVLDPYWYTTSKPDWGWTLGEAQYNWFRQVISTSTSKFKFVFCHQLVGGNGNDGRGGTEFAGFFEMGGRNNDSTWGFDNFRPGWEKTIHELMVENRANIFFHGHDHCYAKQELDGIVYQEVPQPSSKNITNITGSQYGYVDGVLMPSRGYLLVTMTDSTARVDYIRTYLTNEETASRKNGELAYSYTLKPSSTGVNETAGSPGTIELYQNYPNPFNEATNIRYMLPKAGHIQLSVFDMYGRELLTLADQFQQAGTYTIPLNPAQMPSGGGIYYYRITVGNETRSMKIICIK